MAQGVRKHGNDYPQIWTGWECSKNIRRLFEILLYPLVHGTERTTEAFRKVSTVVHSAHVTGIRLMAADILHPTLWSESCSLLSGLGI
jgi:hypothetical protein